MRTSATRSSPVDAEQRLAVGRRELAAGQGGVEQRRTAGAARAIARSTGSSHSATASISSHGSNQLMTSKPPACGRRYGRGNRGRARRGRSEASSQPGRVDVAGIDGQALGEREARRAARGRERGDVRPGRLGVHVVGRQRRDAAPVVDARRAGGARGRRATGWAAPARSRRGRARRRATAMVRARSTALGLGRVGQRDGRLGAEVLDDDLLDVAVRAVQVADGEQAVDALASVSPMPIRMPVVNGMRSSPASRSIVRRTRGLLVGRPLVAPARARAAAATRLEHEAEADVHAAQARHLVAVSGCRRWCAAGARSRARCDRRARRTRPWSRCPSTGQRRRGSRETRAPACRRGT